MTPSALAARIVAKSRHIGGTPSYVSVSDFVLRNELHLLLASVAEAIDCLRQHTGRAAPTPMSQDAVAYLLKAEGFDEIASAYHTWCRSQREE